MDFATIGVSAILSAVLFIILEFSIILPLFVKIVKKSVDSMVNEQLIPHVSAYIDLKLADLTQSVTKSLLAKIRGMMGGRTKGFNSLMTKLSDPDLDPDDIDLDDYEPSTIDKILTITSNLSPILQSPLIRGANNGTQKNNKEKDNKEEELRRSSQDLPSQRLQLERFS